MKEQEMLNSVQTAFATTVVNAVMEHGRLFSVRKVHLL